MKTIDFMGLECVELENRSLRLVVSSSAGPRVLSFGWQGGENLFAELPDFTVQTPRYGPYRFYGGHRLWLAPEDLDRTYIPDDGPAVVVEQDGEVTFTQPPDPYHGIEKALCIRLAEDAARVRIRHTIRNLGAQVETLAPWAITQLRPGGVAVLPQVQADTGLLPNRSLTLWPYTDVRSPHIRWGNRYIFVISNMHSGALKLSFPNPHGWLACWLENTLFVKRAAFDPTANYYDCGSSSACYCNPRFLELETLGRVATLAPGEMVEHIETWDLYPGIDCRIDEDWAEETAAALTLNAF